MNFGQYAGKREFMKSTLTVVEPKESKTVAFTKKPLR